MWFILILFCLFIAAGEDTCHVNISQSNNIIWKKIGEEAVFNCTVISKCSVEFYWFKENVSLPLHMSKKYQREASFQINSLKASDSGMYFCAAATQNGCCTPFVGEGATLVVRGKDCLERKLILQSLKWRRRLHFLSFFFLENAKTVMGKIVSVSLVLLAVYSLAIVTLIILKKVNHRHIYFNVIYCASRTESQFVLTWN